jgi:hypothetical protein
MLEKKSLQENGYLSLSVYEDGVADGSILSKVNN